MPRNLTLTAAGYADALAIQRVKNGARGKVDPAPLRDKRRRRENESK